MEVDTFMSSFTTVSRLDAYIYTDEYLWLSEKDKLRFVMEFFRKLLTFIYHLKRKIQYLYLQL